MSTADILAKIATPRIDPVALTRQLVSGARTGEARSRDDTCAGEVSLLQRMLNALHSAELEVDGSFGPATQVAVKSAQRARGLKADGRVGPATRRALNAAWTAHHTPSSPTVPKAASAAKSPKVAPKKDHADPPADVDLRTIVREELAKALSDEDLWRHILTGMRFFKDPATPGRGELSGEERIPLGRLMELAAGAALDAGGSDPDTIRSAVKEGIESIAVTVNTGR